MPFLGLLLVGLGVLLSYSALKNRSPKDELLAALRGDERPGEGAYPFGKTSKTSTTVGGPNLVPAVAGAATAGTTLSRPIGGAITSGFGMRNGRMHYGVDIPAPSGTPIAAAAAGTVLTNAYEPGGAGNYITLKHSSKLYTKYFHMVKRSDLRIGQAVSAGQIIGYVGSTGNSSGPHLHFEVHEGGTGHGNSTAVDPKRYIS